MKLVQAWAAIYNEKVLEMWNSKAFYKVAPSKYVEYVQNKKNNSSIALRYRI
jgi:hypothetical protein